jgi:hypothetical protein
MPVLAYNIPTFNTSTSNDLLAPKYDPFTAEYWVQTKVQFNNSTELKDKTALNAIFKSVNPIKETKVYRNKGRVNTGDEQSYDANNVEEVPNGPKFHQLAIFDKVTEKLITDQVFTVESLSKASSLEIIDPLTNGAANTGFLRQVYAKVSDPLSFDDDICSKMLGTIANVEGDSFTGKKIPNGYAFGYLVTRKVDGIPGSTYDDKVGTKIGVIFIQDSTAPALVL